MGRKLVVFVLLFVLVRGATIFLYRHSYHAYGMIAGQFAIAEGAFHGHAFAQDSELHGNVVAAANAERRFIPIEGWRAFTHSDVYTVFPAQDLPGYGYLMAWSSRLAGGELTARWALLIQLGVELGSLLVFLTAVGGLLGTGVAWIAGLLYLFAYPCIWPLAGRPMRDIFVLGCYAACIASFLLFVRGRKAWRWAGIAACLAFGSLLLWVRPSGYYFFFLAAPLAFLAGERPWRERLTFFLLALLLPLLVFGLPLRRFNRRYYGTPETWLLGRTLWEGMGIVPDNPYGFALDDGALEPWARLRGLTLEYGSPQLNRELGRQALRVIRQDPGYYLRTVLARVRQVALRPLDVVPPFDTPDLSTSGQTVEAYARARPGALLFKVLGRLWSWAFFYGGLALVPFLLRTTGPRRAETLLLLLPFFYTLLTLLPLHFEARYLATGAWVLILPLAAGLARIFRTSSAAESESRASSPAEQLKAGSTTPPAVDGEIIAQHAHPAPQ